MYYLAVQFIQIVRIEITTNIAALRCSDAGAAPPRDFDHDDNIIAIIIRAGAPNRILLSIIKVSHQR